MHGLVNMIVWLSLMRVTDWLNTVTWLTNISVCCPPQSCGGGTLIDTTKGFHSFHANKMAKWACDTIASNMYVDRPWPRAGCFCAHSTIDTHCTARNLTLKKPGLLTPSHSRGGVDSTPPSDLGRGAAKNYVIWHIRKPYRDE